MEIYKGWAIGLSPQRPVTGQWRATRFGVGLCAGTKPELIRMIDVKNAELTHSTHQRENA